MRAAGAGEEHAELASLTRGEGLTESLGGLGIVLGQKVAGAVVGLALLLAGLGRAVVLACGRVGRTADLDRDCYRSRGDFGVSGAQDELVDDLIAFDRDPMRTDLATITVEELAGGLGAGDIARAIVVGEVDASVEDLLLHLAAEEMHFGNHSDGIAMRTPATDGAEEVDAIGDGADRDFDLLGKALGVRLLEGASFKNDDVQAILRGLGVDDLIRDAVGFDFAELGEGQGITLGFLVGVEAGVRRGGEGRAKIEQTEAADGLAFGRDGDAAKVSDHIAQAFGSKGLEAFGHERVRATLATDDICHLELGGLAGRQLELHEGRVLAADEGGILRTVLHLDVPGAMLVVDHAVRVHDVHEHLGRRVRADAL